MYRIGNIDVVVPVVDGVALHEMLGDRWPGIPVDWIRAPSRQWLGAPAVIEYGRPVILDGECGSAGCCGVVARISVMSETVVWDQFHGHGAPDIPDELRFEFDRADYEQQLAKWPQLPVFEFGA